MASFFGSLFFFLFLHMVYVAKDLPRTFADLQGMFLQTLFGGRVDPMQFGFSLSDLSNSLRPSTVAFSTAISKQDMSMFGYITPLLVIHVVYDPPHLL